MHAFKCQGKRYQYICWTTCKGDIDVRDRDRLCTLMIVDIANGMARSDSVCFHVIISRDVRSAVTSPVKALGQARFGGP